MSIQSETASEYFGLAAKAAERGDRRQAIYYGEKGVGLMLRSASEPEAPGTVIGESIRYGHLGHVLAEKRRLGEAVK